jgi:hypothetical protein
MRRQVSVSSTEVHLRAGHGVQPAPMTKLAMTRLTTPDGVRRGQTTSVSSPSRVKFGNFGRRNGLD